MAHEKIVISKSFAEKIRKTKAGESFDFLLDNILITVKRNKKEMELPIEEEK